MRCVGISHFFGGVQALSNVTLDLHPSSVVGLVGENGAGKTTLTRILAGLLRPDLGEIWFGAERIRNLTPHAARALGVETVPQNLLLCDNLAAPANVMLGQEPYRFKLGPLRFLDKRRAEEETVRRLADLGAVIPDLTVHVRRLSGGQRQAVAIARATVSGHRLMMFDEPTGSTGASSETGDHRSRSSCGGSGCRGPPHQPQPR